MKIIYRSSDKKFRLSRNAKQRWHLIRILLTQLITHERIKTTSAKAKHLTLTAERVLSKAKKAHLNNDYNLKKTLYAMLTT